MDWRALLVKYIAHVSREEGTDFLSYPPSRWAGDDEIPLFTEDEWSALHSLDEEATEQEVAWLKEDKR